MSKEIEAVDNDFIVFNSPSVGFDYFSRHFNDYRRSKVAVVAVVFHVRNKEEGVFAFGKTNTPT